LHNEIGTSPVPQLTDFATQHCAGVIRRLPLLRPGLLVIGLLYCLVGINFIFHAAALLGILPSAGPIPIYLLLITLGALVAGLAYLIGLAVNWKRLSTRPARAAS
jgi:hypothetical protein